MRRENRTGSIDPNFMFNIWRFKSNLGTYKLIDTYDIEVKKPNIPTPISELHRMMWLIKDIGEKIDEEMYYIDCDAWTIQTMYEYDKKITVSVDVFKKDILFNKLKDFINKKLIKGRKV